MLAGDRGEALLAQHHRGGLESPAQLLPGLAVLGLDVLGLHLGGVAAVLEPELDQLGPASDARPAGQRGDDRVEGAAVDGVLVEAELQVGLHRGLAGRAATCLEVHDHHPAVAVELDAVGVADQPHALAVGQVDLGGEARLGADQASAVVVVPAQEAGQGDLDALVLAGARPRRAELQAAPHRVDLLHQQREALDVGAGVELSGGDALGDRVHHLAEVGRLVGADDAARLVGQEPPGRADPERVEHRGGDRDRLLGIAQRLGRQRG